MIDVPPKQQTPLLETKSKRTLLSVLAGSSVALIAAGFDVVTEAMRVPSWIGHGLDFCLMLAFWTVSFWVIFSQIQQRQEAVRRQEQQIAELNHNIRNALMLVLLVPGLPPERSAMVREAVARIDEALRRVAPMRSPPGAAPMRNTH